MAPSGSHIAYQQSGMAGSSLGGLQAQDSGSQLGGWGALQLPVSSGSAKNGAPTPQPQAQAQQSQSSAKGKDPFEDLLG